MSDYILLLRGGKSSEDDSPEQKNNALQTYRDWAMKLQNENKLLDAANGTNGCFATPASQSKRIEIVVSRVSRDPHPIPMCCNSFKAKALIERNGP